ncbi:hypothetical protein, partial [Aliivibrio sp.]|uniref:hypothetical protein n=1 Tax=Aliivibrio sp. TaxID=1872443 RepID=UPI003D2EE182
RTLIMAHCDAETEVTISSDTLIKQNAIDKGLPIFDVLSKGRLVICGNRLNPTLKAVSYRSLGVLSVRCEVILKCLSFQAVRLHFPCVRTVLCGWVREQFTLGSGNHH